MTETVAATASRPDLTADMAPVELPAGALGTPDPALPVFARLAGRVVVVVELGEYRRLLTAASQDARGTVRLARAAPIARPVARSTIDRDPEVADFLRERFPRWETLATLHAACVERFGQDRAPSQGRIQKLRTRWRGR